MTHIDHGRAVTDPVEFITELVVAVDDRLAPEEVRDSSRRSPVVGQSRGVWQPSSPTVRLCCATGGLRHPGRSVIY